MKKIILSTLLILGVTLVTNAMRVTVCVGVGVLSVCTDFEISCQKTSKGGVSCTVDPASRVKIEGNWNRDKSGISLSLPRKGGWERVEIITIDKTVYLLDAKGRKSTVRILPGKYNVKNGVVVFTTVNETR